MRARTAIPIVGALLLFLLGIFLPVEWYDALPTRAELPTPPVRGVTLLRISFGLEGLFLLWLAVKRWTFEPLRDVERLPRATVSEGGEEVGRETALWILASIAVVGLLLRLLHLNSDLWLDEITPILEYGQMSVLQVVGSYSSTNNHLLNTLLMKFAIWSFGEREWTVRLPAVIFGAATIPAFYWVTRLAFPRVASLCAALLLAVSYHHIFFSQNGRGYTAYLLFSILSTGLLVRGLQEDRARTWLLYVAIMVLNFAALLNSGFVLGSHIFVGSVALIIVWRRGYFPKRLFQRLVGVFGITAFLAFQLYATVLPRVFVVMQTTYAEQSTGYPGLSLAFFTELVRGVSAGFGSAALWGALPFVALAAFGFIALLRRQWALALALVMPEVLTGLFLIARGFTFSPRFFLLALPLAMLSVVAGLWSLVGVVARYVGKTPRFVPRLGAALVLMVAAISAASLPNYYSVPKQSYRASIEYVEATRQPDEIVIVIHLAEWGYRYYGQRYAVREGEAYFFVRSEDALENVLSTHAGNGAILVTTFHRALRLEYPKLAARINSGWSVDRAFPATIGDGQIVVWKRHTGP